MSNVTISDHFQFPYDTLHLVNKNFGSTVVIKYGGSVMKNQILQLSVIKNLSLLCLLGVKVVLVHGGGYLIDLWLNRLNIKPKFEKGLRVTDPETMEVVEMVLTGQVNKSLVSLLNQNQVLSIGLSGKDANLIQAAPLVHKSSNLTGQVDQVNTEILHTLLSHHCIPVIASVASGNEGQTYNINADTLASAIASSLKADKLILLTDTPGVLYDVNDPSTLIKDLNIAQVNNLKSKGIISSGMIPKLDSCVSALTSDVKSVHIIDGRLQNSLLYELFTNDRVGSMLVQ